MKRILLVDDEPEVLESTRELLEAYGFEVLTEREAANILPRVRTQHPDVVLQDVRMPNLDLHGVMQAMRTDPGMACIPVILFSATESATDMAALVGAVDAIQKPFLPERLVNLLREWSAAGVPRKP